LITIVSTSKDVLIMENYCFSSHVKDLPNVQATNFSPDFTDSYSLLHGLQKEQEEII
jgi:hypothetical protein